MAWSLLPSSAMDKPKKSLAPQITLISLILAIFAALTLPMNAWLLDTLLTLNLVLSLVILVLSLNVTSAIKLFTYPTILFLLTLLRLSLNIASTRLILSGSDAGTIIHAFGTLITNGNLFVGLVGFLVLQVIQFMIIAKGSERVAEVAARFSLDALPGRQMSIDADLRAGLISAQTAQQKRNALLVESRFYGAMDGAMKFIKGETMAGFIIVFINFVAGAGVGMLTLGMPLQKSIHHFARLTMGDGLAAQIPSLMLAIATGFLITRVSDEEKPASLDQDILKQILHHPATLGLVGVLCLILAVLSPAANGPLAGSGMILMGVPFFFRLKSRRFENSWQTLSSCLTDPERDEPGISPLPLRVDLHPSWFNSTDTKSWVDFVHKIYPGLKIRLENHIGIALPELKFRLCQYLPKHGIEIHINEIRFLKQDLESPDTPTFQKKLLKVLAQALFRNSHEFLGVQEVKNRMDKLKDTHADLIYEIMPRLISLGKLTEILKRLLRENIPVRDLPRILEILITLQADQKDPIQLTEELRQSLKLKISQVFARENRIEVFLMDPDIEQEIMDHTTQENGEHFLKLDPKRVKNITKTIQDTISRHGLRAAEVILLSRPEVRRFLKRLIETSLPDVSVLSFLELDPNLKVDCRDTIGVS